jgi:hypothetical protein
MAEEWTTEVIPFEDNTASLAPQQQDHPYLTAPMSRLHHFLAYIALQKTERQ